MGCGQGGGPSGDGRGQVSKPAPNPNPVTPDGRYFVVRGRLWRASDPALSEQRRARLVSDLMTARRDVGAALRAKDSDAEHAGRQRVDQAKHGLGERGPVWWDDGAPDYNRHMAHNTPYADWFGTLGESAQS